MEAEWNRVEKRPVDKRGGDKTTSLYGRRLVIEPETPPSFDGCAFERFEGDLVAAGGSALEWSLLLLREPAATPTPGGDTCVGDCDGDGRVSISELVRGVRIALEQASLDECPSFDRDRDGAVEISELIAAVNNALNGCQ